MKKRIKTGYTFRCPDGTLDNRIVSTVEAAQNNAAFSSKRPYSHIEWPADWNRAYQQGFRIITAKLVAGRTYRSWQEAQTK